VEDFHLISGAYNNLREIDSAARRLRDLGTRLKVDGEKGEESAEQTEPPLVANLRTAFTRLVDRVPELNAIPLLIDLGAAAWEKWQDLKVRLQESLAESELKDVRDRTEDALEIVKSAAQDSMLRRLTQRSRQPSQPAAIASARDTTLNTGRANEPTAVAIGSGSASDLPSASRSSGSEKVSTA
jgi:hypothetical protein